MGAMKILSITIAGLAFLLAAPVSTQAKDSKSKKNAATPQPETSDRITALHLTSITLMLYSTHQGKEYRVTPQTAVSIDGQPSAFSNLATGMLVTVASPDGFTAATIDAHSAKK